ncbi:hypothetical protein HPB51_007375 [Rhipicephalus microplus]|uniref:Uncharacterized protein n=1 Tax=Rhipicephalus microplus TaxID=6941 RepID=A0A9J6EYU0_RHIMP|nr:hypothetical protein HPB51_007375 [Rhipicephalus microplus]
MLVYGFSRFCLVQRPTHTSLRGSFGCDDPRQALQGRGFPGCTYADKPAARCGEPRGLSDQPLVGGDIQRRCSHKALEDEQVKLKLHRLFHSVSNEDVRIAFVNFGKVVEVSRERWHVPVLTEKYSTRTVLPQLKSGYKVENLPHQIVSTKSWPWSWRLAIHCSACVAKVSTLATRHVRRECKVPRCSHCRRLGHVEADLVRTYASATRTAKNDGVAEHVINVAEMKEAAEGTCNPVILAKTGQSAPGHESKEAGTPRHWTAPAITSSTDEAERALNGCPWARSTQQRARERRRTART